MAFLFPLIIAALILIVRLVATGISSANKDGAGLTNSAKKGMKYASRVFVGLAVLFFVLGSIVQVSTKNVGIETAFGKTTGELSNGLHLKAPWVNVTEMDAAIQTDNYASTTACTTSDSTTCGGPVEVRIANQQTAQVHVSIRWRIDPTQADSLFQNYRSFDNLRDSLVTRELTSALNTAFANYNPLNTISIGTGQPSQGPAQPTLADYAGRVTTIMRHSFGDKNPQIEILSTIIPLITFDPTTQGRLNSLQQQIASTRIALQQQQTNQAQAAANAALAQSVNTSPNVLVAECMDFLKTLANKGVAPSPGFSCWPGSGSSAIIASGK